MKDLLIKRISKTFDVAQHYADKLCQELLQCIHMKEYITIFRLSDKKNNPAALQSNELKIIN